MASKPQRHRQRPLPDWNVVHDLGHQTGAAPIRAPRQRYRRRRVSAGLLFCRPPAPGRPHNQVLTIRGRLTYAFTEFVHGRYAMNDNAVRALLNNMSLEERMDCETLDFDILWRRIWGHRGAASQYDTRRAKFHASWIARDRGAQLLRLLRQTRGVGPPRWEFPKGKRVSSREGDVACALREFWEETGIPSTAVRLLPGFRRVESYVHMDVLYVCVYFMAVPVRESAALDRPAANIDMRRGEQVSEVSDIKWMGLTELAVVDGPAGRRLAPTARAAFNYLRRWRRGRGRGK